MHFIYLLGEMDRQEAMKGKFSSSFYAIQIHSLPANMVLTSPFPPLVLPRRSFRLYWESCHQKSRNLETGSPVLLSISGLCSYLTFSVRSHSLTRARPAALPTRPTRRGLLQDTHWQGGRRCHAAHRTGLQGGGQ